MSESLTREVKELRVDVRCLIDAHACLRKELALQDEVIRKLMGRVHALENRK